MKEFRKKKYPSGTNKTQEDFPKGIVDIELGAQLQYVNYSNACSTTWIILEYNKIKTCT